jgi:hypothetical protein
MAIPRAAASLTFDCPRCRGPVEAPFYGPCSSCRAELRATLGGEARAVERAAFEPAMHVTPNAVALKE